jgi:hypothetical protein
VKISDVFAVEKIRGGYAARISGCSEYRCTGKTKEAAMRFCLGAVEEQGRNLRKRAYFWSPSGKTVFVVSYQDGWFYEIHSAGRKTPSCCVTGDTFGDCCQTAARHAAEYVEP